MAHEDHARRAVLAALGIRRQLAQRTPAAGEPPVDLAVRMGLHTGPVVVGTIGDNMRMDYTAIGDTTNLAARLHHHAEPGSIVISEATGRLVKGYVCREPLPPLRVKVKEDPIGAFAVLGLGTRRSRLDTEEDRALSLLRRSGAERAALRDLLGQCVAGGIS